MSNASCIVKARQLEKGVLHKGINLGPLTSWKVGGSAEFFYLPKDEDDFAQLVSQYGNKYPITILGLGSNVLISEEGVDGIVVLLTQTLDKLYWANENMLIADAGVSCAKVAKFSQAASLSFFAGIPGTIGGALAMNAGAFGGETWQHVSKVDWITAQGEKKQFHPHHFDIAYRQIGMPEAGYFIRAYLSVSQRQAASTDIRELLQKRASAQPIGQPSCGSVFKNPPGHFAAKLIEECGLKGMKVGGAMISPKHANFFINQNQATSDDIIQLMKMVIQCVLLRYNVRLEPEVRFIGKFKEEQWMPLQSKVLA